MRRGSHVSLWPFMIHVGSVITTLIFVVLSSIQFTEAIEEDVVWSDSYVVYVSKSDVSTEKELRKWSSSVVHMDNLLQDVEVFELRDLRDVNAVQTLPNVIRVERQEERRLALKTLDFEIDDDRRHFNDPLLSESWHLTPKGSLSMAIDQAWSLGYTGKNVNVMLLDNGVEYTHPELIFNFRHYMAFDIVDNDLDPYPSASDYHGTSMSGLIAARANNHLCSIGVAYEANLGTVKMFETSKFTMTDLLVARGLNLSERHADILLFGFGAEDSGFHVYRSGVLETTIRQRMLDHGRQDLGTIMVWAAGNGGTKGDSCALEDVANAIGTVTTAAVGESGSIPYYAERCSAILATTASNGRRPDAFMVSVGRNGSCSKDFSGTSASSAIMAASLALVLEANSALHWRDVQHLIVRAARSEGLQDDFVQNAAGRSFSHYFGFGLLDVHMAVQMAQRWRPVPQALSCEVVSGPINLTVDPGSFVCTELTVTNVCRVSFLEHVVVTFSVRTAKRGDVELTLTAPSGTSSLVLPSRRLDYSRSNFVDWKVTTRAMWEEKSNGIWRLCVKNVDLDQGAFKETPKLQQWSLKLHGTSVRPQ